MKKLVLLTLLISLSAVSFVTGQTKQSQEEMFQATYNNSKSLVISKQFQFISEAVFNDEKRQLVDGKTNRLKFNKAKVSGKLASFSSFDKTVNLDGRLKNYKSSFNDAKYEILILFNIGTDEYQIKINKIGKAFLSLNSGNNNITQLGRIERI
ncbi:hypothetical protein DFQ11_102237 [Winogradskyella epiphytica]|uniref:DUF4251 domain-containing protein n=1 Tax=Winogradskyella epiphytica TaxID=262005 RepID=A0A2V4XJ37_9FLAO|nr:hypothetical protein [Winogradskyella epiphytica]PYE81663.1 hypothetical protein DFQ11_102237 [Winogradskyella epiphytica]GGW63534.1 hypothetical protein GCM10008085_14300 [Winogradskyella epiphytica]